MWPETTDAIPPANCWIDALIALNEPRWVLAGIAETSA